MKDFNTTSSRYSIEKAGGEVKVIISSRRNLGSILFLTLWVLIWVSMVSGLSTVLWSMFTIATGKIDPNYQVPPILVMTICIVSIFFLVLVFLGAFGIYSFLWELTGKEFIEVNQDKMTVTRQLFSWKRISEFSNKKISGLTTRNTKQSLFWIPFQKRYRYALELNHDGKIYRFGNLVKEMEAKDIASVIQVFILPIQ